MSTISSLKYSDNAQLSSCFEIEEEEGWGETTRFFFQKGLPHNFLSLFLFLLAVACCVSPACPKTVSKTLVVLIVFVMKILTATLVV